jgi:hypothetical protein
MIRIFSTSAAVSVLMLGLASAALAATGRKAQATYQSMR